MLVSTLVVEWIEIIRLKETVTAFFVSTLVVEWIEIGSGCRWTKQSYSLHPRGGVD